MKPQLVARPEGIDAEGLSSARIDVIIIENDQEIGPLTMKGPAVMGRRSYWHDMIMRARAMGRINAKWHGLSDAQWAEKFMREEGCWE